MMKEFCSCPTLHNGLLADEKKDEGKSHVVAVAIKGRSRNKDT